MLQNAFKALSAAGKAKAFIKSGVPGSIYPPCPNIDPQRMRAH